jgi:hypothetical protein
MDGNEIVSAFLACCGLWSKACWEGVGGSEHASLHEVTQKDDQYRTNGAET